MSKLIIDGEEIEIDKEPVMDLFSEDLNDTIEMNPVNEDDHE